VQPALRVIHSHSGPSYASSFANIYSTNIYSDLWNMKPYHSMLTEQNLNMQRVKLWHSFDTEYGCI